MFSFSEEAKISDVELIRAIRPGLSSLGGRLLAVGTPYSAQGYSYKTFKKHFGNDESDILVWNAASTLMNPKLDKRIIARAIEEDPTAANCEYCTAIGLFREDVDTFIPRQVVEALVVPGRLELAPRKGIRYAAFADVSGGRHDDAALAIAHRRKGIVIIDCLERYKSPHVPAEVVARMCETLKRYNLKRCQGDAYAAEWTRSSFKQGGIDYQRTTKSLWKKGVSHKIAKPKSVLYTELLPRLNSGEIELLDDEVLVTQLSTLQRRTRSGGKDIVDHAPGAKDDLANCIAGVSNAVTDKPMVARIFGDNTPQKPDTTDDDYEPNWVRRNRELLAEAEKEAQEMNDRTQRPSDWYITDEDFEMFLASRGRRSPV